MCASVAYAPGPSAVSATSPGGHSPPGSASQPESAASWLALMVGRQPRLAASLQAACPPSGSPSSKTISQRADASQSSSEVKYAALATAKPAGTAGRQIPSREAARSPDTAARRVASTRKASGSSASGRCAGSSGNTISTSPGGLRSQAARASASTASSNSTSTASWHPKRAAGAWRVRQQPSSAGVLSHSAASVAASPTCCCCSGRASRTGASALLSCGRQTDGLMVICVDGSCTPAAPARARARHLGGRHDAGGDAGTTFCSDRCRGSQSSSSSSSESFRKRNRGGLLRTAVAASPGHVACNGWAITNWLRRRSASRSRAISSETVTSASASA